MEPVDFEDAVNILRFRKNFNDISSSKWELIVTDPMFKKTWVERCAENEGWNKISASSDDSVFPMEVALDELEMLVCDLRNNKAPYKKTTTSEEHIREIIDLKLTVINLKKQINGMEIITDSLKELLK